MLILQLNIKQSNNYLLWS